MLNVDQYQKLKVGDQIRFSRDLFTVKGHEHHDSHTECLLVSDEGVPLHNGIYVTHLMAFHGSVDLAPVSPKNPETSAPIMVVSTQLNKVPEKPVLSDKDEAILRFYQKAEAI